MDFIWPEMHSARCRGTRSYTLSTPSVRSLFSWGEERRRTDARQENNTDAEHWLFTEQVNIYRQNV
jgi:hypothetical protein